MGHANFEQLLLDVDRACIDHPELNEVRRLASVRIEAAAVLGGALDAMHVNRNVGGIRDLELARKSGIPEARILDILAANATEVEVSPDELRRLVQAATDGRLRPAFR